MKGRRGLGRGLDALLSDGPAPQELASRTSEVVSPSMVNEVLIDSLIPNRYQPRSDFDSSGLEDLAESIRAQGIVQPIVVAPIENSSGEEIRYTIIAGERRWRAARLAELDKVPVVVRKVADDQQMLEMALVENLQRADLNPVEEAEAYRSLGDSFGLSQEDIASRVGKGRTTITNALRLLRLPEEIQDYLREGRLTAGQARPLLAIPDRLRQIELAERAVHNGLSARELEALVAEPKKKDSSKKASEIDANTRAAMERLTQSLQARVDIIRKKKGGQVRIFFHSEEELMRLYDFLMQGNE